MKKNTLKRHREGEKKMMLKKIILEKKQKLKSNFVRFNEYQFILRTADIFHV